MKAWLIVINYYDIDDNNSNYNNNDNNNNNYVDGKVFYLFYRKLAELLPKIWQFCFLGRFATIIGRFATRLGRFATKLGRFATFWLVHWQICYQGKRITWVRLCQWSFDVPFVEAVEKANMQLSRDFSITNTFFCLSL